MSEQIIFESRHGKITRLADGRLSIYMDQMFGMNRDLAEALSAERAAREAAEEQLAEVRRERDGIASRLQEIHALYPYVSNTATLPRLIRSDQRNLAAAQQRIERLREAIRALLALHVTNGPLEVIEYGPGGTTDEEVAHRKIIDAIHQAALTESEATNA